MSNTHTLYIYYSDNTSKIVNLQPSFFEKKKMEDIEIDVAAIALDDNHKQTRVELTMPNGTEYKRVWIDNLPKVAKHATAAEIKAQPPAPRVNQHGKEVKRLHLKPRAKA